MTVEELEQKARETYPITSDSTCNGRAQTGYIAGANMILESEEYRLLVHEARLWRRHQEEQERERGREVTDWRYDSDSKTVKRIKRKL